VPIFKFSQGGNLQGAISRELSHGSPYSWGILPPPYNTRANDRGQALHQAGTLSSRLVTIHMRDTDQPNQPTNQLTTSAPSVYFSGFSIWEGASQLMAVKLIFPCQWYSFTILVVPKQFA